MLLLSCVVFGSSELLCAQRSAAKDFPLYANGGWPDLVVDPQRVVSQMEIVDRYFAPGDCALVEGVVGGSGYRRLLRFDTIIMNRGDGNLVVGDRSDPKNPYASWFVYNYCHQHFHIREFSVYELLQLDGKTLVTSDTKQGFCFEDSLKYDGNKSAGFDCNYQGITSGWGDWYYKQLAGQWIDITGVPQGTYLVRITINKGDSSGPIFFEGENRYSNVLEVQVQIPNPRNKVAIVP